MLRKQLAILLVLMVFTTTATTAQQKTSNDLSLTVMSFNILFNNIIPWTQREGAIMEMIGDIQPDIIGLQENTGDGWPKDQVLGFLPSDKILEHHPQYAQHYTGDVVNTILYKKDKYTIVETGYQSIAPSASWRHVQWILFRDNAGNHFYAYNTHWNHVDAAADGWMTHGRNTINLIKNRAHPEYPAFITGDFNTQPNTLGNLYLKNGVDWEPNDYPLRDTWTDINGFDYTGAGSYGSLDGGRIDYVFAPLNEWNVIDAYVVSTQDYWVSDHLPVVTVFGALDPFAPYFTTTQQGTIYEGAEDGATFNITLTNTQFISDVSLSGFSLTGQPEGVTIGSVVRTSDTTATVTLSGNARIGSYTGQNSGTQVTIEANQLVGVDAALSAVGITFNPAPTPIPGTVRNETYVEMSGIQLEPTTDVGGGQSVGYIEAGDWMKYEVNVNHAGTYELAIRSASLSNGGQAQIMSGDVVLATVDLPVTGGWQNWETTVTALELAAGIQTLTVMATTFGFNLNWMEFTHDDIITSVPQQRADQSFMLYPNPSNGLVRFKNPVDQLSIYSLSGQRVYDMQVSSSIVDLSQLETGAYLVVLKTGHQLYRERLVIR